MKLNKDRQNTSVLVKRFDRGTFDASTRNDQGFLVAPVKATRTGVFVYQFADGKKVRELRHPDEVFHPDSLKTLANVPMTNEHPQEMVDASNARLHTVGWMGESVTTDGRYVMGKATVFDGGTIAEILAGKEEISCGYLCEMDETPGEFEGERYDVVQRKIRYNHFAVVKKGRAGPEVRLKLDAADAVQIEDQPNRGAEMKVKILVGGKEFEIEGANAQAVVDAMNAEVEKLTKESKDAADALSGVKSELEQATGKVDGLQGKVDSLTEQLKVRADKGDDKAAFNAAVSARIRVLGIAKKVLAKDTKFDEMTDLDLMKAVVEKQSDAKLDGKSAEYITARFDVAVESDETLTAVQDSLGREIVTARDKRDEGCDPEAARKKAMDKSKEAWKSPSPSSK